MEKKKNFFEKEKEKKRKEKERFEITKRNSSHVNYIRLFSKGKLSPKREEEESILELKFYI